MKSLEIDFILLESEEFPIFVFQNRKGVRNYGRVRVYIECRRIEGVSLIFLTAKVILLFFVMEDLKSISSFDDVFLELQEYCDLFEDFNSFGQDLKPQAHIDGEKWERPWVYKEDKDSFDVFC